MKKTIFLAGAAIGITMAIGAPTPSLASDTRAVRADNAAANSATITDFSARKKYRHRYYAPWPLVTWGHGYRASPNYGTGTRQLRQQQRSGRCVIDEGYGRMFACQNS